MSTKFVPHNYFFSIRETAAPPRAAPTKKPRAEARGYFPHLLFTFPSKRIRRFLRSDGGR